MVKFKFPGKPSKIGHRNLVNAYNVISHSNGFNNTEISCFRSLIQNTVKEKEEDYGFTTEQYDEAVGKLIDFEHKIHDKRENITVLKNNDLTEDNNAVIDGSKKLQSRDSTGRVIIREARLNISSQTMIDGPFSPNENDKDNGGNFRTGSKPLSGYITCGICRGVRYYKYILQTKKYGIYSCEPCRKFILRMLTLTKTPHTKYIKCKSISAPGGCVIPTSIVNPNWKWNKSTYFTNRRCEVCWLILCLKRYRMPLEQKKLLANLISDDIRPRDLTTYNYTTTEPVYCNRPGFNNVVERTTGITSRYTSTRCRLKNRLNRTKMQNITRKAFPKIQRDTKRRERLREKFNVSNNLIKELDKEEPELVQKGPRIKHVCRSASSVLKATQIIELPIENQVEVQSAAIFDKTTVPKRNNVEEEKYEEKTRRISRCRQSIEYENEDEPCATGRPYGARSLQDFERETGNESEEEEDKLICTDYWENHDMDVIKRYGFALIMSEAIGIPPVCFLCGSGGVEKLLHCICCCEPYHWYCVNEDRNDLLWKSNWICPKCKLCLDTCDICGKSNASNDADKFYCTLCYNVFHRNCVTTHNTTNPWICDNCKKYYKNCELGYKDVDSLYCNFGRSIRNREDYVLLERLLDKEERKIKSSIDIRRCVLCKCAGEGLSTEQGRLLYCGQNEWIHTNCALWSSNVFEIKGYLHNVHSAVNKARHVRCALCTQKGASISCSYKNCPSSYHFQCARKLLCLFGADLKIYCPYHDNLTTMEVVNNFRVFRPIYVEIEEKKKKFAPNSDVRLKIGALDIENLGKIDQQLSNHKECIVPLNFRCTRLFWSTFEPWKIVRYVLEIKIKYKKMDDTGINYTVDHTDSSKLEIMQQMDVIPPDLKHVIYKDLNDLDDITVRDIWMNYDDTIKKMKEKDKGGEGKRKIGKYQDLGLKKRKMSFLENDYKKKDEMIEYEISQLDGVCDGYMESDDEAQQPTQYDEQPVRCTKCDRTYRTNMSYEKHLETCTLHFGDYTSESEEERQQPWQEIQPQPDLYITGFNDNRNTIQIVINEEEKKPTLDYYAIAPQQPIIQIQPVEQSYVIQEPVSYITPELILTPQLQLQPVIMQPVVEPTYIMNTAPLMLQQPVYIDGGLGAMVNNTIMSQFVSHSMTNGLNYSATTTQLLQTTNPVTQEYTTGYIIINEQQNEPVKRKQTRKRNKKQTTTRNDGYIANNNGAVILPVSTSAPCINYAEPASCISFAKPATCISYAEPAPFISFAEPAPRISCAEPAPFISFAEPVPRVPFSEPTPISFTEPIIAQPNPVPLIELPTLQTSYPFVPNIPKPFQEPEYKLYASVGTSTSDLTELPTPDLSSFSSTPIISLPAGSIIPTMDFQTYQNPTIASIFQAPQSHVPPPIVTPNTNFQVSFAPSAATMPSKLSTSPIMSSSVKCPTVTPTVVSSPSIVPPRLETPLIIPTPEIPTLITPNLFASLPSPVSSTSELCTAKSYTPCNSLSSTVDFSSVFSYASSPSIPITSTTSPVCPLPEITSTISTPRVSIEILDVPSPISTQVSITDSITTEVCSTSRFTAPPVTDETATTFSYVQPSCKSTKKSSLPLSTSPTPKTSSIPSLSYWRTATISYEVTAEDGFSYHSNCLKDVWNKVFDNVQKRRLSKKLPLLPKNSLTCTESPNCILGLDHNATKYILEQLPDAFKLSLYQPTHHNLSFLSGKSSPVTNESGCARTEPFSSQHKYDMFGWLASRHRRPPKFLSISDSNIINGNRRVPSLNLPIAMRFRHLRETAKKTVGVFRSDIQGRGLFCLKDVDIGEMVIEYAGEVIRSSLTDKREKYYTSRGIGCYMFRIDDKFVVDATMAGNAARFINHSCEPNCYSKIVEVLGMKHILIFALRKIKKGEELTYDYKFPLEEEKLSCHCLSRKCRKYLN